MKCPKCQRRLRIDAEVCLCGWSKTGGVGKHSDCAHAPSCTKNATIREKTITGWAAFCEDHYVAYHHAISARRVREELGLQTVEEMKEFCRSNIGNIFKKKPAAEYWQKVLAQAPKGSIAEQAAREFLEKRGLLEKPKEREPGQDDEEITDDARAA